MLIKRQVRAERTRKSLWHEADSMATQTKEAVTEDRRADADVDLRPAGQADHDRRGADGPGAGGYGGGNNPLAS